MSEKVVTRFAPSPTGMLHIGGARTALFNWLFARNRNGEFRLRIEDTDRERSRPEASEAILSDLRWLGLDWDGDAVSQHERRARHLSAAAQLLEKRKAYKCFSTPEEIAQARELALDKNSQVLFRSPWRNAEDSDHPNGPFTIRLKSPDNGKTHVNDVVSGTVSWSNDTLDDIILIRSDGSPTYNFAVVVDDHDMGVTHVIRGDDHLSNSARQTIVFAAFGWSVPTFAHIPLIHGEDGRKLSKRSGDLGLDHYRRLGIPPEAIRNYLARLGWSHGNDEFFSTEQAIEWFSLEGLRKSPARLDQRKLLNLSMRHIETIDDSRLADEVIRMRRDCTPAQKDLLALAIPLIRRGTKTFAGLADKAEFLFLSRPIAVSSEAQASLDERGVSMLINLCSLLGGIEWTRDELGNAIGNFCADRDLKLGMLAQPVRAALAGSKTSPSMFDMFLVLGKRESLARLEDASVAPNKPATQSRNRQQLNQRPETE